MVFCLNVINKARIAKRTDFIYFGVLLSLIITQILIQISPEIRGSIHIITYICIGMILALALVYLLTRITISTPQKQEDIPRLDRMDNVSDVRDKFLYIISKTPTHEGRPIQDTLSFGFVPCYEILPTCA